MERGTVTRQKICTQKVDALDWVDSEAAEGNKEGNAVSVTNIRIGYKIEFSKKNYMLLCKGNQASVNIFLFHIND